MTAVKGDGVTQGTGVTAPAEWSICSSSSTIVCPLGARGGQARALRPLPGGLVGAHPQVRSRVDRPVPVVVFVCRDRARARECARRADTVLSACRAYAGEYPADWEYPGRERILFVAERDVYEGSLRAYGVPRLPPEVRTSVAHGDPRAGEAMVEVRGLLG